ncbi:hypothetical protein, variant [Aphanomyces astaci]|uniref:Pumilio domain-containing protein NOP9 n=1 Tax=Aphanomyces astaci TaxID=112090 RepID=W4FP43_APHAT|nr:hypothetical protein, variant [Aphanomyces astaci]ETV69245.1 hypothetical protein, variant [Aphanomyces astaci]|eukprot:XP_009841102.1 hypothetical protein, variant [Aphanomyces astaci]
MSSSDHDEPPQASRPSDGRPERVRPRRLEPDTLAYLQEVNASFLENLKDGDVETSRMLLWNVLEEIAPRVASAASDRHACEFIEVLVDHMSAQQLRFFLHKMEGYFSHLWTNRYSSHVLQRLLSKVGTIVGNEVKGEADDDDDPDRAADVPPMSSLIVAMCSEVQAEWLTLINDVSASHVMRAVFCALAGRAPVLEKRGKKGKHKALQFQSAQTTAESTSVPREFEDTLSEMLELVLGSSDGRLVELMSDAHAGPVLSMAVRVAPSAVQSKVIFKLLKWNDPERSSQRFYDFAADSVASHFLEAVCHSCDEDVWAAIFERCLQGRLLEFSEHPISNFVVQNFIQRTPTSDLAETVLDELQGALWSLLSSHRAGVIWRLAELCERFKLREKSFFLALVAAIEKLEAAKPEVARRDVVSALIGLQLSNNQNSRLTLNVPGARIVETLLKFPGDVSVPLVQSILKLNSLQLVALAKDSTGSRCLVEPIWASDNQDAKLALFEKLQGQFGSLVLDRNGSFTVLKCFDVVSVAEKTAIAEELSAVDGKLAGSHFASMVLTHCNVHEFKSNREKWLSSHERKKKVKELFSDFMDDQAPKKKRKHDKKDGKKSKKKAKADE